MKTSKITLSFFALFTLASSGFCAAITTVSFDSGSRTLTNLAGVALNGGSATVDGDGDVLQLGFFNGATSANIFGDGTFIALSGQGSANVAFGNTSIGDYANAGAGDGTFGIALSFNVSDPTTSAVLPTAGTPLAIRIFNGTSLAQSTQYETISSIAPNWLWKAPGIPPTTVALSLDDPGLRLFSTKGAPSSGGTVATQPIVQVPEPASISLVLLGSLIAIRRRKE